MNRVEEQLLQVTKAIERQVDETIDQIDNLDVNDIEQLRKNRVKELKQLEEKRKEWLANGHGKYEELAEEKQFFDIIKKSENVVIHFYTPSSQRSPIMDKHLKILAPKHLETLFTKLNAEKCPFLAEKLKVKTIPTLALIQKSVMVDKVVGFTHLGNRDDFTTDILEWRIAQNNIINYEGDLSCPPNLQEKKPISSNKKIRDSAYDREDDDLDIEEYAIKSDNLCRQSNYLSTELSAEEAAELGLDE